MPLPGKTKFRVRTTAKGEKVRLAFLGGQVIEAKNLRTGATHTPAEFRADRKRRSGKPGEKVRRALGR